jgi:hypothetical protein
MRTWWAIAVYGSLAWYALLTGYVAWRGAKDIRGMLTRLARREP